MIKLCKWSLSDSVNGLSLYIQKLRSSCNKNKELFSFVLLNMLFKLHIPSKIFWRALRFRLQAFLHLLKWCKEIVRMSPVSQTDLPVSRAEHRRTVLMIL